MIIIVTTGAHRKTHKTIELWPGMPKVRRLSYRQILSRRSLPTATYIFTDFDRLNAWEVELAAGLFRTLNAAGVRVLNDPGRFRRRHAFLSRLRRLGINSFRSWSAEFDEVPDRYPVFLRTQAAHRGPLTGLLEDAEAARNALADARKAGFVTADLHFVEYAAEPLPTGIFRKLSAFRIGDRIVQTTSVHSSEWVAKTGQNGIGGEEAYREERNMVTANPYRPQVMAAFEAAEIDYGRADFVETRGRLEFFEINTNPTVKQVDEHPSQHRIGAFRNFREQYCAAMREIDTRANGRQIRIDAATFRAQRLRTRRFLGLDTWVP